MTETNKQTAPDIIEIGGIKYQRVEEPPQPRTLHNILQTYWNVDESESINVPYTSAWFKKLVLPAVAITTINY